MKNSLLLTALLLTAGSFLPACNTINSTERAQPVGQANIVHDKRIINDSAMADYAHILSVNEATVSGDILKIQVHLRNESSFDQNLIYKFEWFDLNGMQIETPLSTWQTKTVQGNETYTLSGVAPTPQAKDFRLKLQESIHN